MVRHGMCGVSAMLVNQAGQKMDTANSNLFYIVVLCPILAPIPYFIEIGWQTRKLKTFAIGRFWLVGLLELKIQIRFFFPILAPLPNLFQID